MPVAHEYSPFQARQQSSNGNAATVRQSTQREHSSARRRPESPPGAMNRDITSEGLCSTNGWHENGESREDIILRVKKEQKRSTYLGNRRDGTVSPPLKLQTTCGSNRDNDTNVTLLPAFEESKTHKTCSTYSHDRIASHPGQHFEVGSLIERPRSALHAGDFRSQDATHRQAPDSPRPISYLSTGHEPVSRASLHDPFLHDVYPTREDLDTRRTIRPSIAVAFEPHHSRNRTVSQSSLSGSFIYRPPTSPLAQHSHSYEHDEFEVPRPRSPDKSNRRHTFSPPTLRSIQSYNSPATLLEDFNAPQPSQRSRDTTVSYQAHQPRRSLGSFSVAQYPAHTPGLSSRRSRQHSLTSGSSPLQHAPMVGGYEESILRGRMSTFPSRPLNFLAQIGVLGKGDCKASLRCPPHVTIPFPAVFYNYRNVRGTSGTADASGPSPYVGLIDIENSLDNPAKVLADRFRRSPSSSNESVGYKPQLAPINGSKDRDKRKPRPHQRSNSKGSGILKKPPKGSYRIPQQGQLQIIIKNPNKTAVKLFLIPYDLSGMKAGQKTFIRQRSYSAGPIIDMPLSSRRNYGTDRPEAAISHSDDPNDRPVLRYLIHVHICCPCGGRFYLYRSIRVVFANRVPDGKEKLRNEIQLPEPRYSTYKVESDTSTATTNDKLVLEANTVQTSSISSANLVELRGENLRDGSLDADGSGRPVMSPATASIGFAALSLPGEAIKHHVTSNYRWDSPDLALSGSNRIYWDCADPNLSPRSSSRSSGHKSPRLAEGAPGRLSFAKIDTPRSASGRSDSSVSSGQGLLALQLKDFAREDQ